MSSCLVLIGQRESLTCRVLIRELSKVSNVSPSNFRITRISFGGYFMFHSCIEFMMDKEIHFVSLCNLLQSKEEEEPFRSTLKSLVSYQSALSFGGLLPHARPCNDTQIVACT